MRVDGVNFFSYYDESIKNNVEESGSMEVDATPLATRIIKVRYNITSKMQSHLSRYNRQSAQSLPDVDYHEDLPNQIKRIEIVVSHSTLYRIECSTTTPSMLINKSVVKITSDGVIKKMGLHWFPSAPLFTKTLLGDLTLTLKKDGDKIPIELPQKMNALLAQYLFSGKPYHAFVSHQFANYLMGFYEEGEAYCDWRENYIFKVIDKEDFEVGDMLTLAQANEECVKEVHSAIYIGHGLFLSQVGPTHLIVSTLEELSKLYPQSNIFVKAEAVVRNLQR